MARGNIVARFHAAQTRCTGRMPASGYVFVAMLGLFTGLAFQGSRGLYESTEGRYALCAKEMLQHGNWLEPTLLGQPHWTKPPLTYWLLATGLKTFGINAWGARVPVALAFALTALATALVGKKAWNSDRAGIYAGLVYATSVFPVAVGFTVNTDSFLTLFETIAVLCYWTAWRSEGTQRRNWAFGLWLALGVAFATKGPPSLVVLPAMIVWSRFRNRGDTGNKGPILLCPAGWMMAILVGGGWYVLEVIRHPELLRYFIGDEIVARIATDKFGRNPEWYRPFVWYLPLILCGGGLWSVFLFASAWHSRAWRKAFWQQLISRGNDDPSLFIAVWLLLPLLIFSIAKSRLPNYVLPLFPAVAVAIGHYLARFEDMGRVTQRTVIRVALVSALVCVSAKAGASYMRKTRKDMGALARLCGPYDAPDTSRFFLYECDRQMGLDFYLNNHVSRVSNDDGNGVVSATLGRACETIRTSPAGRHSYFIVKKRNGENRTMLDNLRVHGLASTALAEDRFWQIFEVDGDATVHPQ